MATHSSALPGKSLGQRSVVGYSPWDRKELDLLSMAWQASFYFRLYNTNTVVLFDRHKTFDPFYSTLKTSPCG